MHCSTTPRRTEHKGRSLRCEECGVLPFSPFPLLHQSSILLPNPPQSCNFFNPLPSTIPDRHLLRPISPPIARFLVGSHLPGFPSFPCLAPIHRFASIPTPIAADPPLSASDMLYLVDEVPSFTFLDAVVCFLLPLSTMDGDRSNIPDPLAMDPKPPDRSSSPSPPRPTRDPPLLPTPHSLEALQVSSRAAQSSSRHAEETVATQFNILMKVADPLRTARKILEHASWGELNIASKDSYGAVNEVFTNLFLATFHTSSSMMFVVKRQSWTV